MLKTEAIANRAKREVGALNHIRVPGFDKHFMLKTGTQMCMDNCNRGVFDGATDVTGTLKPIIGARHGHEWLRPSWWAVGSQELIEASVERE